MRSALIAALALASCQPAFAQSTSTVRAAPAVSGGFVVRAGSGYLSGANVTSGASAGYVMVFDSATVPADGAVAPIRCVPIAANTGIDFDWRAAPLRFDRGAAIVFSTTGCFTKTASATAFIAGDVR
jgi:hypothetical protein